jgi:AcrR family transcriptional regulator
MGIAERRLRQKEEIRSNILTTAWRLVKEEGWQSLSIRKIADAIEYSIPVIYGHFESKEEILLEFSKEGFRQLLKRIQLAKAKSRNPEEQLRAIADAYWNFAFKNQEYFQLMFGLGMPCCETEGSFSEKADLRNIVMEPITTIIKTSKNSEINPCLEYHTFCSILHGLVTIKMMNYSHVSEELNKKVLDNAVNCFIKNLY